MKTLFVLSLLAAALLGSNVQATPAIRENDASVTISSGKSRLVFNKQDGTVKSLRLNGTEYVHGGFGFRPLFWRKLEEKDVRNRIAERSAEWKDCSQTFPVTGTKTGTEEDGSVYLRVSYQSGCEMTYRFRQDGALNVQFLLSPSAEAFREPQVLDGPGMMYDPDQSEEERQAQIERFRAFVESVREAAFQDWLSEQALLPRVGMRTHLPTKFYFEEQDGRLAVTDRKGRGFVLLPESALQYSILHKTVEDLEAGSTELRPFTELCIEAVPTDESGYFLPSDPVGFGFTLIPVRDADTRDILLR